MKKFKKDKTEVAQQPIATAENVATNAAENIPNNEPKAEKIKKPKKKKSKAFKIFIGILIFLIIGAIAGAAGYFFLFPKTIDLSDCITVDYTGYNGYATATVEFDQKKLKSKIRKEDVAKDFAKTAELSLRNSKNLSNGDELEVRVSISEGFLHNNKLKLKDSKIKIKVEGLEEFSSLDLTDYIKLEYKGFNKHATAKATFDESLADLIGKDVYRSLQKEAVLTVTNNGKLENDKDAEISVSISTNWLREHGIDLKSNDVKIKVSGLEEATEVDAFSGMKVNISGMSPNLSLSITNESTDEFIKTIKFTASKTSGIANGDTIKIEASSWDTTMAEQKGYVLKENIKDYKVENQAAYIYKSEEITADIKSKIKTSFIEKARSEASDTKYYVHSYTDYQYSDTYNYVEDLSVGQPEIVSLYLLTKKADRYASSTNKLIGIVRVPFTSSKTGVTYNWYITIIAKNISLKADGSISDNTVYDIESASGQDEEKAYSRWVNYEKDSFDVDKIPLN
ncbi:MAG: hypothetical protein IKQ33_05245 [Clostridia bacterium]|nr:hypothetical protein [Clostridia bacterium]